MNTKECKSCGWVYPITQRDLKCPLCGVFFDTVTCKTCGAVVSGNDRVPKKAQCKKCHNEEERQHMIKYVHLHTAKLEALHEEWLDRIAAVPKDYPTLTEEQWLEACTYFNGCAWCGDHDIDTRGFYVDFQRGGRYCDWNIIPLCKVCARSVTSELNPYRLAEVRDRALGNTSYLHRNNLQRIVDYLGEKLRKGVEYGQQERTD